MERFQTLSVGDVLRMTFQENCMQEQLDQLKAAELWPQIVGAHLASRCSRPKVKDGILSIGVSSTSLRHELSMNRSSLINEINRHFNKTVISDIRFVAC